MHIDLNSCFATVEQQANPLLRNKPVVVAAHATPNGCILSPSIEAKKLGIKTGMTVREAKLICNQTIVLETDPPKYRDVHIKFRKIFNDYSDKVTPKSIDEAIIDFTQERYLKRDLTDIALEIKQRMRREIGEWISCSVGIAPNRFLAKLGASLHKPNGLDTITHENLRNVYASLVLVDLHGIATHNEARLNTFGIFTPLQFLDAPREVLEKKVFQSIVGYYWYLRLRGWEIDDVEYGQKSIGQQYALYKPTADPAEISRLLMKLCEKMGRRLRKTGQCAQGVHVAVLYKDYTHWHKGKKFNAKLYTTVELYRKAQYVLNQQPKKEVIKKLAVSCFDLVSDDTASQMNLFGGSDSEKMRRVTDAMDKINDKFGEYVITPATMMEVKDEIQDSIAFGRIRELEKQDVAYIT